MGESPEPSVESILKTLDSKTSSTDDRLGAYSKFDKLLRENDVSLFHLDVTKNFSRIAVHIQNDMLQNSAEVCQLALQVLGICLHDSEISRDVSVKDACVLAGSLCQCVLKTEDKTTCTRALWCAGKQNLPPEAIQKQLDALLGAVEHAISTWQGQSITVEHECVNTIARLIEQAKKPMGVHSARWGKLLLRLVAHNAIKVRERVLAVIEMSLPLLLAHQKEIASSVVPDFKSKICGDLKKLFETKHEIFVLKAWGILVQIFGEEIHRGSFANHMLAIAELGFKSPSTEIKCASYSAWQYLIDNFSTNPSILGDPKRIKLTMQVFKLNNAKVESVAMAKLNVWWHFIWLLGNKVSSNFDQVAVPLLHFCAGGSRSSETGGAGTPRRALKPGVSPVTPRINLTSATGSSAYPVFPALQLRGCEVLAHFLGSMPEDLPIPEYVFQLPTLRHDIISGPAFFGKHSAHFITTAAELFVSLGKDLPEGLLYRIWYSLIAHTKNLISNPGKTDIRETLALFLMQFRSIILSQVISTAVIIKMFYGVCSLPRKVLCSTAYNISGGQMVHGTPALFLMELLLKPALLQSCTNGNSYQDLFSTIIECGLGNSSGTLGFLHSVLQLMKRNAEFLEDPDTLAKFWGAVVSPLLEHITKTNEVNQGDALEYNFDCINEALIFPVAHKLATRVPQSSAKTMMKTWQELYKTSARLTAMVTNAEANIVCETFCHGVLELLKDSEKMDSSLLDCLVHACQIVVSCVDFSSLGSQPTFNIAGVSPGKWTKRRLRPLETIHSLVVLLTQLLTEALQLVKEGDTAVKKTAASVSLPGLLNTLVDTVSALFSHVSSSSILSNMIGYLAEPIGALYQEASKKTSKVFNNAFQQKLEKLWMEVCTSLQSRYSGMFDSEFLDKMAPMLAATFLHSRRQIKNQTMILWNSTFSNSPSLDYPELLKPVLSKVKDKGPIQLPGWVAMETLVIEETPVSQMSQSQAPEPRIPGMPSPHKIHGSFLNKAVSPGVKKSPARHTAPSPKRESARKKVLSFGDFRDDDFVVIKSPPKKKTVLTEHQKEVLKERKSFPAMYNNLELSQDVSLFSHFNTDTQQELPSATPTPTDDSVIIFGSVVPKEPAKLSKTDQTKSMKPQEDNSRSNSAQSGHVSRRRSVRFKDKTADTEPPEDQTTTVEQTADTEPPENNTADAGTPEDKTAKPVPPVISPEAVSVEPKNQQSPNKNSDDEDDDKDLPSFLFSFSQKDASKESDSSGQLPSIQQNLMAVRGYTQTVASVPSSTEEDVKQVSEEPEEMEVSSQPLLSWKQKLSELSQSPSSGSMSNSPKRSSSQSDANSPVRKSSSRKSPRKGKKKIANENECNLDSWVIRSPGKPSGGKKGSCLNAVVPSNTENVQSVTFVEETQSPKKFSQQDKVLDKGKSILETPPKFTGEGTNLFTGNSSRKLFEDSLNHDDLQVDVMEDSNMVPDSPHSKSGPFVKLKRLTSEDIEKFSPKHKETPAPDVTPSKKKTPEKLVTKLPELSSVTNVDENSHEHDDFSEIKPLDDTEFQKEDCFFSDQLTDTEKAMLTMAETDDSERMEVSVSEHEETEVNDESNTAVQSQSLLGEANKTPVINTTSDYNPNLNNTLKDSLDVDTQASETESQDLGKEATEATIDSSQESESQLDSSYDMALNDTLVDITPRRSGRKRKQGTPKKFSPDDFPGGRKRKRQEMDKRSTPLKSAGKLPDNKKTDSSSFSGSEPSPETRRKKTRSRKSEEDLKSGESDKLVATNKSDTEALATEKADSDVIVVADEEDCQIAVVENCDMPVKLTESEIQMPAEISSKKGHVSVVSEEIGISLNEKKASDEADSEKMVSEIDVSEKMVSETDVSEKTVSEASEKADSNTVIALEPDSETTVVKETPITLDHDTADSQPEDSGDVSKHEEQENLVPEPFEENSIGDKKEMEEIELVGQKTPESRSSTKQPERKSTTKKKKEVAQKRSHKRGKDVVVNEVDSYLDVESSDEDVPLVEICRKVSSDSLKKLNTESDVSGMDNVVNEEKMELSPSKAVVTCPGSHDDKEERKSSAVSSDDEVPLNLLASKKTSKKDTGEEKGSSKSTLQNKPGPKRRSQDGLKRTKTSPMANKLRSSQAGQVNTRLRSGSERKKSVSPRVKKSVSLALKRTRGKSPRSLNLDPKSGEEKEKVDKTTGPSTEDCVEPDTDVKKDGVGELKKNPVSIDSVDSSDLLDDINQADKRDPPVNSDTKGAADVQKLTEKKITLVCHENMDETPRKASPKRLAASLFMRNSDSKLVMASRKFAKGRGCARRSILKPSAIVSDDVSSPKKDFHPIQVGQIYSPTASPSASILKKRRLSEDTGSETSSPPAKQRRVSFAEPLTHKKLVEAIQDMEPARTDAAFPPSPLVSSSDTRLSTTSAKFFTSSGGQEASSVTVTTSSVVSQSSMERNNQSTVGGTPSQNSYQSTQESELNDADPVCPDLLECDHPVEKVLPNLTSTMWSRGLGQLVRARNIHTIGDLSALTETEIHSLPIRSPKVETVRKALGTFEKNLKSKRSKLWGRRSLESGTQESSKSVGSEDVAALKKDKESINPDGPNTRDTEEGLSSSVEAVLASSGDLLDEVAKLRTSQNQGQSEDSQESCDNGSQSAASLLVEEASSSVGRTLDTLSEERLQAMKPEELLDAHQKMSDVFNTVLNRIASTLRHKCTSAKS